MTKNTFLYIFKNNSLKLSIVVLFLTTLLLNLSCSNNKAPLKPTKTFNTIDILMKHQETSWNNGDIDAFMDFYWESDSLQFIGKNGVNFGWLTTLNNYKKSYNSNEKMGNLSFENISHKILNNNSVLITGKWHLSRNEELKDLEGHYTLIWKMIDGHWKIVYDHSS